MYRSMSTPPTPASWRQLLGKLILDPAERLRAAQVLHVNPITLVRWANGESEPRFANIKKLPDVFPPYRQQFIALIQKELPTGLLFASTESPPPQQTNPSEIPSEYIIRALLAYGTTRGPFAVWSQRNMALQQLLDLLTPHDCGMEITIVRCVPPPPAQPVRSLCEMMGIGTPPWKPGVSRRLLFLGAESLAGWTTERGEPGVIQDLQLPGLLPFRAGQHERSAAAYPFLRRGKIAGCLLAVCTQENAWTPARLVALEVYSHLLALSFCDEEFYAARAIRLHGIPEFGEERAAMIQTFPQRVRCLREEQRYALSETEAETMVLQQMESELLQGVQ